MVQAVEHLLCICKALSSTSSPIQWLTLIIPTTEETLGISQREASQAKNQQQPISTNKPSVEGAHL
jgi:hypothetical protein